MHDPAERGAWLRWGPYLSERQWGTVREDYSDNGDAWSYFSHDQSRSRAYRWGEDGLAGISDDQQRLCLALALWNEHDPILKERLFGLTNAEGNHGEDVKEYYFYVDNVPSHSYQRWQYKYPQAAFPYGDLVATNRARSRFEMEYELLDTGVFADDRYFDVRSSTPRRARRSGVPHHGPQPRCGRRPAPRAAHPVVPQHVVVGAVRRPSPPSPRRTRRTCSPRRSTTNWARGGCTPSPAAQLLFCDNETNTERVWGEPRHLRPSEGRRSTAAWSMV